MATVRTIEQWVFSKLEQKTGTRPSALPGENLFSIKKVAGQDVSIHVAISDFLMETIALSKDDADTLQADLVSSFYELRDENFILQSTVRNETSQENNELWRYITVMQLRHRKRNEWEV